MILALWWILIGISVIVCMIFAGIVFPKVFLKADYRSLFSRDRGLRKFKEKNGNSIIYQPLPQFRRYISQYILSARDGKRVVICKLKENFSFLDYDIIVFNSRNKAFQIVNVKENIKTPMLTRLIELPQETDYISLVVNFADNIDVKKSVETESNTLKIKSKSDRIKIDKKPYRGLAFYSVISGVLIILEAFLIKLCLANIFGDVFWEDFMANKVSIFITLAIGLAAAVVVFIAALVHIKLRVDANLVEKSYY